MEQEARTLGELLDTFDVETADLIGHSDGATIALLFAAARPERVRRVVSIAAHCFVEPATTTSIRNLVAAWHAGEAEWLTRLHGARAGALLAAWADVWLGAEHALWDVRADLERIRCPVLAIQGAEDEFGSIDQIDAIAEAVENVSVWQIAGSGHTPHMDAADGVAARLIDFLAAPEAP